MIRTLLDPTPYVGVYLLRGALAPDVLLQGALALDVRRRGSELVAAVPGVPEGYEIVFEPCDAPHGFRLRGGPLDGALVSFQLSAGRAGSLHGSGFELDRVGALPEDLPARLLAPEMTLDAAKRSAFSHLLEGILERRDGAQIDYRLPYPKHEFLRYAAAQDRLLFHGSNNPDIEVFRPVRTSAPLQDADERGNLQAVYTTHDGLWPMFFAVVDRARLEGSIRNGVMVFHGPNGEPLPVYNFSIDREQLAERPWRTGTLYLLPRDGFRRLEFGGGALSNEWASEVEVRPLARLALEPREFPFLDRIGGHLHSGTDSKTYSVRGSSPAAEG